jgi:hypothetical protein
MPDEYEIVEHGGKKYRVRKRESAPPPAAPPPKKDDSYWGGTESWVD